MDPITSITQCEGTLVNSIPFSSPNSGVTYTWSNSNTSTGLTSFGSGAINSFTTTNPGNAPITSVLSIIPSIAGCDGPIYNFTISIEPAPSVNAGLDQTVCSGSSVTLTGSGASTYTWDNNITDNTAFTVSTSGLYTVTGVGTNGCEATDQVLITVNALPTLNAGLDQVLCLGDTTSLVAIGTGINFSWNQGITNNTPFTPTNTTTYTLTGIDALTGCVNSDQIVVTVNPLPNVNAGADFSVCDDTQILLSGSGATNYTWSNGIIDNQLFTGMLGETTYTVTGVDQNGCSNTDSITVTVIQIPSADFTADINSGYPTLTVNFTNTSSPAASYQWMFGNGFNPITVYTPSNQTSFYTQPGVYTVQLTASNDFCQSIYTMPITVIQFPPTITYIPNVFTPNNDKINDEFFIDVQYGATIEVDILNRWGDKMHTINNFTDKWNGGDATEGVYFYTYKIKGLSGDYLEGHGNVTLIRK
jgi:gliding motility-associated-like protein